VTVAGTTTGSTAVAPIVAVSSSSAFSPALIQPSWVNVTTPADSEQTQVPSAGVGAAQLEYVSPAGSVTLTTASFAAPAVAPDAVFDTTIP
jgi:hypothetical protein